MHKYEIISSKGDRTPDQNSWGKWHASHFALVCGQILHNHLATRSHEQITLLIMLLYRLRYIAHPLAANSVWAILLSKMTRVSFLLCAVALKDGCCWPLVYKINNMDTIDLQKIQTGCEHTFLTVSQIDAFFWGGGEFNKFHNFSISCGGNNGYSACLNGKYIFMHFKYTSSSWGQN